MTTSTETLPRSTPEAQGIPSAAITAFLAAVEQHDCGLHSLMLLRHGHVVAEGWWSPYPPSAPHILYSLSKSFTSTAIGLAVAEGRLSVDDPVLGFFSAEAPRKPSANLAAMRIRHLLSMSTGHDHDTTEYLWKRRDGDWPRAFLTRPVAYAPATHFLYNTGASYMLSAIIQRVTGQTLLEYLRPRLFEPLGIEGATWQTCPRGQHRWVRPQHQDGGYRPLRAIVSPAGHVAGPASFARSLGGRRVVGAGFQCHEHRSRLAAGLRLSVLALPARRLPRRWRVRSVLRDLARPGRGGGDHRGFAEHAGSAEPDLGAPASRHASIGWGTCPTCRGCCRTRGIGPQAGQPGPLSRARTAVFARSRRRRRANGITSRGNGPRYRRSHSILAAIRTSSPCKKPRGEHQVVCDRGAWISGHNDLESARSTSHGWRYTPACRRQWRLDD